MPIKPSRPFSVTRNELLKDSEYADMYLEEQGNEAILADCKGKNTSRFGKELIEALQEALAHAQAK